jgi:hypothetical protein
LAKFPLFQSSKTACHNVHIAYWRKTGCRYKIKTRSVNNAFAFGYHSTALLMCINAMKRVGGNRMTTKACCSVTKT